MRPHIRLCLPHAWRATKHMMKTNVTSPEQALKKEIAIPIKHSLEAFQTFQKLLMENNGSILLQEKMWNIGQFHVKIARPCLQLPFWNLVHKVPSCYNSFGRPENSRQLQSNRCWFLYKPSPIFLFPMLISEFCTRSVMQQCMTACTAQEHNKLA